MRQLSWICPHLPTSLMSLINTACGENSSLQSACCRSDRSVSPPGGQGGEQVMSGVSWVFNDTAGLLLESASVNVSEGGSVVLMALCCLHHPLQVLPVLLCSRRTTPCSSRSGEFLSLTRRSWSAGVEGSEHVLLGLPHLMRDVSAPGEVS